MARAVTPVSISFRRISRGNVGGTFHLWIEGHLHESPGGGPAPGVFDVDLHFADDPTVLGTGLVRIPFAEPGARNLPTSQQVEFLLPGTQESQNLLEEAWKRLSSGETPSVRLVFRPSRHNAIAQTDWDRYWGGTVDVVVPVGPR